MRWLNAYVGGAFALGWLMVVFSPSGNAAGHWQEARIPGTSENAITLGRDLDGDGDPDEVNIRLEVIEVQEEVFPGEKETFWVFAPEGEARRSESRKVTGYG